MQNKIIFRVDGHQDVGLGHVIRCLALADMLRDEFQIVFASQKRDDEVLNIICKEGFDLIELPTEDNYEKDAERLLTYLDKGTILVLDGYQFRETFQLTVRPHCHKLVCIDDIHSYHLYADVIINHSEHAKYAKYSCEPYTQLYLGGKYALLRNPFLKKAGFNRTFEKPIENIMICMGGADPTNQTLRIIQAIDLIKLNLTVNVVIGVANPNYQMISQWVGENENSKLRVNLLSNLSDSEMCEQLMNNDFLFTPGSTTAWEACCIGIPMIVGVIADNQICIAEILEKKHAALNIGWYKSNSVDEIKTQYLELINDKNRLQRFIVQQKMIVDGKSRWRYRKLFSELSSGGLT